MKRHGRPAADSAFPFRVSADVFKPPLHVGDAITEFRTALKLHPATVIFDADRQLRWRYFHP